MKSPQIVTNEQKAQFKSEGYCVIENVIDPDNIINNYGADSVRLFILSDSPPEKDVQWSEQGMISSYKFVQKLWMLHLKIKNKLSKKIMKSQMI